MLERLLWLAILLRPDRRRILSDGKSAGDYCGGVFAKWQLERAHALWRPAAHQAAGNVRGYRSDQLAPWRRRGWHRPTSVRASRHLHGYSPLLASRPATR